MSLKAFHLFFIIAATALCAAFGGWSISEYSARGDATYLTLAAISLVAALSLAWYFPWALKKMRNFSYLLLPFFFV